MERLEIKIVEESKKPLTMHPKKFAMWVFLASVVMLFASLTSAYIVRRADGNWTAFDLPALFYSTTIIVLLSSVTMQWAYSAARKKDGKTVRTMTILTAILGITFLVGQFAGLMQLENAGIHWTGNPSGTFVMVLAGLHGVHLISAIVFVFILLGSAIKLKVKLPTIEMCATYWHFLGGLWLYLFVFLLLTR
jgi:cytochrome c oxidase subunit 3